MFFVYDLAASIFGWRDVPISWTLREAIEIMATVGRAVNNGGGSIERAGCEALIRVKGWLWT